MLVQLWVTMKSVPLIKSSFNFYKTHVTLVLIEETIIEGFKSANETDLMKMHVQRKKRTIGFTELNESSSNFKFIFS